jgi:hypothetical protein
MPAEQSVSLRLIELGPEKVYTPRGWLVLVIVSCPSTGDEILLIRFRPRSLITIMGAAVPSQANAV